MTREAMAAARLRASTAVKKATISANQTAPALSRDAISAEARVMARTATG